MKRIAGHRAVPVRVTFFFLIALSSTVWSATGSAQAREGGAEDGLLAIGTASSRDGNLAAARRHALADALKKGVEEVLLRRLDGDLVAGQLARFVQDLVPAAQEEIANFNILAEEDMGGTYRVLVRFRVNEQTLESTLERKGFLRAQGAEAKVLFMVSQHTRGSGEPAFWWKEPGSEQSLTPVELFLTRTFETLGFSPAGRTMKVPEGEGMETLRSVELTREDAAEWGRICAADVVVIGSSVVNEGLVSLHLKAVDVGSASLMAEQGGQAALNSGLEETERARAAIEEAVETAAVPLANRIRDAFRGSDTESNRITLTLQGVGSFSLLQQFTRFLQDEIPGVSSVAQTRFKGDTVTFSIGYPHGADRLLESLRSGPEQPFPMTVESDDFGGVVVSPL